MISHPITTSVQT